MCMPVNSRYCLICLLVYLLLPNTSADSSPDPHETTVSTYIPLKDNSQNDPDETEFLQLPPSKENMTDHNESQPQHYFVHSLMKKYGNGIEMTFEGFEHLLENIGLGKFMHFDHSVKCHRINGSSFLALHSDHNHTGEIHSDVFNRSCDDVQSHVTHSHDHHETEGDAKAVHDKVASDHRDDRDHEQEASETVHEHEVHDDVMHEHTQTGHEHEVHDGEMHEHTETGHKHSDSGAGSERTKVKRHLIEDAEKECLTPMLILNIFGETDYKSVNEDLFTSLCPALIYQLDKKVCTRKQDHDEGHQHDDHEHEPAAGSGEVSEFSLSNIPAKVWGFSAIAVVVISLVGLLGVAVIPIMQKVFYNHMLQFLVALAVGALSGDALLHLLPHAIEGGHSEGGHDHHGNTSQGEGHSLTGIYKGLCGLMGIYFFFLMERILTIFTDIKRKRKQKSKRAHKHKKDNEDIGERLASTDMECGEMMMSIHPNKALKEYADEAHSEHCKISFENTTTISHQHGSHSNSNHSNHVDGDEGESMISHSSRGHGHSHCHDGVPNSVSAIAWMVILGDGIHNFSDGLAIGAAFSNSITGGFSTAIAVFCHELPHEIGDFAMLLRAGMSAKQAIIYNCLSSILCFIGMLIGVAIGNIQEASLWIFAIVGGMFLYIALVDMPPRNPVECLLTAGGLGFTKVVKDGTILAFRLWSKVSCSLPEMTSVATKKGENPFKHLFLQLLGMLLGAGIMLTIALKEEELRTALDS